MDRRRRIVKNTISKVIHEGLDYREAAAVLGVSIRTVHNYVRRYLDHGPEGLLDRRCGHFRKIEPDQETRILVCKLDRPYCSARWIRDRLKLPVSVEAVRQVLLKYHLNRSNLGPNTRSARVAPQWDPF